MKWDTVVYSRTKKTDYRWITYPEYFNLNDKIYYEIMMAGKSPQLEKNNNDIDWLHNFVFVNNYSICGIFRIKYDVGKDVYGRAIKALEGIVCPVSMANDFVLDLPNIIYKLYFMHSFMEDYFESSDDDRNIDLIPKKFETECLINPLIPMNKMQFKDVFSDLFLRAYHALIKRIASLYPISGFCLGEKATLYVDNIGKEYGINEVFDGESTLYRNVDDIKAVPGFINPLMPEYEKSEKVALYCSIKRQEKYGFVRRWVVMPYPEEFSLGIPIYYGEQKNVSEGIFTLELVSEAMKIKDQLAALGWQEVKEDGFVFVKHKGVT